MMSNEGKELVLVYIGIWLVMDQILSCSPFLCRRGVRCCIVPLTELQDFSIVLSIFPKELMWSLKVQYWTYREWKC